VENNTVYKPKANRAFDVLKRVPGGDKLVPMSPVDEQVVPPVEHAAPPAEVVSAPIIETEYDIDPPAGADTLPKNVIPAEFVPEDATDEVDQLIDKNASTGENFKKLRTKLKAVTKERAVFSEELEGLRKKVKEYDDGLAVPDVTQRQTDRITELEKYERIYNLKASPVYQEKIATPLTKESDNLQTLATDHTVEVSDLHKAFGAATDKETNQMLMQAFKGDEVAVLDAKVIFKNIKRIQNDSRALESDAQTSFTRMQEDNDRILAEKQQKANASIVHASRGAWSDSLAELRTDSRFREIQYVEGDTEHNERYVRPILTKAAQEYGRTISILAQHGLTELPKELAMKFARADQLAHYSAVLLVEKNKLAVENTELKSLLKLRGYLNNPSINGTGASSSYSEKTGAVGTKNVGAKVLDRVMNK